MRLEPGSTSMTPALTRCVEAIEVGAPWVKISTLTVSALEVKSGESISICYAARGVASAEITPPLALEGTKGKA